MHEIVEKLAKEFSIENLKEFLIRKNPNFTVYQERLYRYEDERFTEVYEVGNTKLEYAKDFHVVAIKTSGELTERTSKKKQYELGKKILKENYWDSGIFVFHDENGKFRFSLIYPIYVGTRREWSNFKRFTFFVSPEETNKTFIQQISSIDFSSLKTIKLFQ